MSFRDLDRLKRTVESIINIDQRVEHIIVLPFNDRDSLIFLDSTLEQNPTAALRYVHDKGQGIYQAMSLGVSCASSQYFTFWNAGDELNSVSELSLLLENLESCNATWILTNGHFSWIEYPAPSYENLISFIRQERLGYVSHQCILFEARYFKKEPAFNLSYKVASDTDQIYRCYKDSVPAILNFAAVSVEVASYSATNQRRARIEVFLIIIRQLNSLDLLYALYNFSRNNLHFLLTKSQKLRLGK